MRRTVEISAHLLLPILHALLSASLVPSLVHGTVILEKEHKTPMSGLDLDINLCQDLMSRSHVKISCRDQMCIFQLYFPCLLLSISQYLAICIYHCPFQFDFPFLLRSISQNWNSAFTNAFLGWIS